MLLAFSAARLIGLVRLVIWHDEIFTLVRVFGHSQEAITAAIFGGHQQAPEALLVFQKPDPALGWPDTWHALIGHPEHARSTIPVTHGFSASRARTSTPPAASENLPLSVIKLRFPSLLETPNHAPEKPKTHVRRVLRSGPDRGRAHRSNGVLAGQCRPRCLGTGRDRPDPRGLLARRRALRAGAGSLDRDTSGGRLADGAYAQEARQYALWTLLAALSSAALLLAVRLRERRSSWWFYGILLTLGLYTHLLFVLSIPVHGLYLLLAVERRQWYGVLRPWGISAGISIAAFGPWIAVILTHHEATASSTAWMSRPIGIARNLSAWADHLTRLFVGLDPGPPRDLDTSADSAAAGIAAVLPQRATPVLRLLC